MFIRSTVIVKKLLCTAAPSLDVLTIKTPEIQMNRFGCQKTFPTTGASREIFFPHFQMVEGDNQSDASGI
jgi:hypothetical protein